ncbi:DUF1254 domain-containing protein [Pseudomonas sp. BN102]|uniref:DUF1254 domain-containing protein n=1 Tax=Pseudomonas sp. BN102 TaxID=2567886 RepID=UPI00245848BF|nr:DUF1254 domain-containing protein [Pseudomonas sp. BN102]
MPVESQVVVRPNRDTLYSSAVFDLDAGPVTVTLPDAGQRYFSMIAIDENQYTQGLIFAPGRHSFTRESVGTRYVLLGVRTRLDPTSASDLQQGREPQDRIQVEQRNGPGRFEIPSWNQSSLKKVRGALQTLAATIPDSRGMFGTSDKVDPVRHLIGSASARGGNPEQDAFYENVTPARNDGATVYRMVVRDVPFDAFWSISVYNAAGNFERNPQDAYTLNDLTAKRGSDGSIVVQFGGCDGVVANCLPITPGWNYMVRLYKPHAEILDGSWRFPEATLAN